MDDYFVALGTSPKNQVMLGMFSLTRDAKLWWKQRCSDNPTSSPSWQGMKQAKKERYLPPSHQALMMNEFYALRQIGVTLEEYYSKFVSLRRYAPQMTMEQQIARFCQGLNRPLSTRLEAMRPTSIQDALIRAKPLATELAALEQGLPNVRYYECNQWGHFWNRCPQRQNPRIIARASPQPHLANQGKNQRGGRNGGHGRGRGARAFAAVGEPTLNDDEEERATLFAVIDNPGAQQQHAVIKTTTNHEARATRSTKTQSSSDDEKTDIDKEESPKQLDEESQKSSQEKMPSEFEKSDKEDTSTPLKRKGTGKSKVPRTKMQITYAQAQARFEERKRNLATVRAAKAATSTRPVPQTMEQARQPRIEAARKLQQERQSVAAEQKAQESRDGESKKQQQEDEENIENIQTDPTPPSPKASAPLASPPSSRSPPPPVSPSAPSSPQQQAQVATEAPTQAPSQALDAIDVPKNDSRVYKKMTKPKQMLLSNKNKAPRGLGATSTRHSPRNTTNSFATNGRGFRTNELEEQIKDMGHEFLPPPLMMHEADLWKEKMRPALNQNDDDSYEGITLTVE
ncbi:hypothetical protein L7F22_045332 [Adiantum nelumboides]|nr:hypothetical protein [Adiantum nelumboides]